MSDAFLTLAGFIVLAIIGTAALLWVADWMSKR